MKPGNLLIAVYGDNWFQQVRDGPPRHGPYYVTTTTCRRAGVMVDLHAYVQVRYTLQVLYPVTVPEAVNRCDKQVMAKRDELRAFERTFTAAQVRLCVTQCLRSVPCRSAQPAFAY